MRRDASVLKAKAGRRRWLALVFPWLPVERLRATRPHLFAGRAGAPLGFVETIGNATRLVALDRAGLAAGLMPGLTLADARARVPGLEAFAADGHADLDWLERLAEGCQRYTPTVSVCPPDALLLDIAGCTSAFDGERSLAADIERRLMRRGVLVRHAFGDTPEIAQALARYAGAPAPDEAGAVRRLPVAALGLDGDEAAALAEAGLKTVGEVMALPLSGIAARFGEAAVAAVRGLSGEAALPIVSRRAAAPIHAERRFAEPVARSEHVLATIAELISEAAVALGERHEGGRRWQMRLFRADGEVHRLRVETGVPTRDPALVGRLLRERIEALADPLDPGFGYDLIRLDVMLAERLDAIRLPLEGGEGAREEIAGPVDRLPTRRGRMRVVARAGDPPEQAELMLPAAAPPPAPAPVAWPAAGPGEPPLRPIHLFDPPQPIDQVVAEVPDGPPRRFRWRRTIHHVARAGGPERIAAEWWRHDGGGMPARDYYRIEDRRGRRLWIFRLGLYEETDRPRWYVHGLFA